MNNKHISFNKVHLGKNEYKYIQKAIANAKISGGGEFTKLSQTFLENKYGFQKCLLTNSCTAALEMAAILIDVHPGDEVIIPSFTFVSTANAFLLRGAKIVFVDSQSQHPNMDVSLIKSLITAKTKAIVVVHYAGISCDMEGIMALAKMFNLYVIEDAAQAIDNYYIYPDGTRKVLGSIGHFGAISFHETKNITCGEGGVLIINDPAFIERSEVIWEKGTNRCSFFRGEVDKYRWVDIGSSFLPSEITAAFLYAQLEMIDSFQVERKKKWDMYYSIFRHKIQTNSILLPVIPNYSNNNAHIFYINCLSLENRNALIQYLKHNNINAIFHYLSLHRSPFFTNLHDGRSLPNSDYYSDTLLRLPLHLELTDDDIERVADTVINFSVHA